MIPTLTADVTLVECLRSLENQTRRDFEVIVVDNSGSGAVRRNGAARPGVRVIEEPRNVGFGAAINGVLRSNIGYYINPGALMTRVCAQLFGVDSPIDIFLCVR